MVKRLIARLGNFVEAVLAELISPGLNWKAPKKDRRNGL